MRRVCGLLSGALLLLTACSGAATSGAQTPEAPDPAADEQTAIDDSPDPLTQRDALRAQLDDLVLQADESFQTRLALLEQTEVDLAAVAREMFESGLVIPPSVIAGEDAVEAAAVLAGDAAPSRLTATLADVGVTADTSRIEGMTIDLCELVQLENCGLTSAANPAVAYLVDSSAPSEIQFLEQAIEEVRSYLDGLVAEAEAVDATARSDIAAAIGHINRQNTTEVEAQRDRWDALMADIAADLTARANADRPSIGAGVHEVGTDISPGTWVAVGVRDCSWARLHEGGGVRASERYRSASRIYVTVRASDWALELTGDCVWSPTGGPSPWEPPAELTARVADMAENGQLVVVVSLGDGSLAATLREAAREASLPDVTAASTTTSPTTTVAPGSTSPPTATTAPPAPTTTSTPAPTTTDAPDTSG